MKWWDEKKVGLDFEDEEQEEAEVDKHVEMYEQWCEDHGVEVEF